MIAKQRLPQQEEARRGKADQADSMNEVVRAALRSGFAGEHTGHTLAVRDCCGTTVRAQNVPVFQKEN